MNAKEMFDELGYCFYENRAYIVYQNKDNYIKFWKAVRKIKSAMPFNLIELKAINKQVKELGWGLNND